MLATWIRTAIPALCGVSLVSTNALAQPGQSDVGRAKELQRQGQKRYNEGRYEEACPLFEQSDQLAPRNDAKYHLALCYEKLGEAGELGKLADALRMLDQLVPANEKQAQTVEKIRGRLLSRPHIVLKLGVAVRQLDGLIVTLDGEKLGSSRRDHTHFVEIGRHVIRVQATGMEADSREVDVTAGQEVDVAFEELKISPRPPEPTQPGIPPPPPRPASAPPPDAPAGPTARDIGLGVGMGVTLTGLAVGIGAGLGGLAKRDEGFAAGCGDPGPPARCDALRDQHTQLLVATGVGFTGAALAAGVTFALWRSNPPKLTFAPSVGRSGLFVSVGRSF